MKKKIVIKVTKQDIKLGSPVKASSCPIALAGNRQLKTNGVAVCGMWISTPVGRLVLSKLMAKKLQRFVSNFDDQYKRKYCRPTTIIAHQV